MKRQVHSLWKMTRRTMLACLVLLAVWQPSMAQTALTYGDVAICGWNNNLVSSNRQIQVVLLKACAANTVFKISALGFNNSGTANSGSNARATAGISKWTNTTGGTLPAGTVITILNNGTTITSDVGTMSNIPSSCSCGANGSPVVQSTSGGRFFIYYGGTSDGTGTGQDLTATSTTATFQGTPIQLFGFQGTQSGYTAFLTSTGTTGNFQTYLPSDLASYNVFHASNAIGGYFTPSRTAGYTAASLRTALQTTSNWTTTSGTGTVTIPSGNFTMGTTPTFTGSTTLSACNASVSNINSNLAITDAASAGTLTETWSIVTSPAHGTLGGFSYAASNTGGAQTPSGLTYTPTSGYVGADTFSVQVSNGTNSSTQRVIVAVNASPNPGTVTVQSGFLDSFCATAFTNLVTSGATGGVWSSAAATTIATVSTTGQVTGIYSTSTMPLGGNTTISYTVSTVSCGTLSATKQVYVRPFSDTGSSIVPARGTVLCTGATLTATSNSVTAGLPRYGGVSYGRTWTTQNSSIASVSNSTGVITAVSAGTVNITYTTAPNGCGSFNSRRSITINASASGGTISGTTTMCIGASNTLTSSGTTGGVWSSSNTSIATVNSSTGAVTGVSAGTADITYTATNSCGSAFSRTTVTINGVPSVAAISGATSVCTGASTTLTNSTGGGTWSSSATSLATVSTTGTVTGVSAGSATITYTVTNACGSTDVTSPMSVNTAASAGTISGASSVCAGATTTYTTSGSGGTWSSSAAGVASVNASTGLVIGVSAGSATITYTVTGACGAGSATQAITVNPLPNAGSISGTASACVGASSTLASSGAGGGTWSSSATGTASVSTSGVVTGISAGSATISYSVTNSCGTQSATTSFTVNPIPNAGTISGASSVCAGANTTLTSSGTSGGSWSSSSTSVATASVFGVVSGLSAGSTTISYTITNSCGTDIATQSMTVNPLPNAGTISGASTLCAFATVTLTSSGTGGGTWSSSNTARATVDASGVVTGTGAGAVTISYSVTNSCGTDVATHLVTVNPAPNAGTISGASSVCVLSSTLLTSSGAGGGTWSTSAASVASVGTSAGLVVGVSAGSATISYSVTNSCGTDVATSSMTVNPLPDAGSLSGASTVCAGATTTITSTVTGGSWSSSNTARATVDGSGVVTGVSAGAVTISYSSTNSCGTDVATHSITVNPTPSAGTISGASSVCESANTTLTSSGTSGGSWSSSSTSVASVSVFGIVYGVSAGSATITYSVTNSCGTDATTSSITVNPLPNAGSISGASSVCASSSTTLSASGAGGGSWSSSNTARATVDGSGVVTGVSAGTVFISYSVTNGCGTDVATSSMTVNALPNAGTITGSATVCEAGNTAFTTSGTGGSWSSSATGTATVTTGGVVFGLSAGSATISYTATNGCGTDVATSALTVNPLPVAGTVSGASSVCDGATTTLTAGISGGAWSSSNTARATVGASSGVVTGASAGSVTISYTVTNSCGSAYATQSMSVLPLPSAGFVSGASTVCQAASTTFTAAITGGSWSSSATGVASVSTTGVVTGVSAGSAEITYTVVNSCGTDFTTRSITVNPLPATPASITGPTTIATTGATITLANTVSGGVWTSSNTAILNVNASSGVVTAVSSGTATITYTISNSCGSNYVTRSVTCSSTNRAPTFFTGSTLLANVCANTTAFPLNAQLTFRDLDTGQTITISPVSGPAHGTASVSYTTRSNGGTIIPVGMSFRPSPTDLGFDSMVVMVSDGINSSTTVLRFNVVANPTTPIITGATSVCNGGTVTLTASPTGGFFGSMDGNTSTNATTGVVTGRSGGTSVIYYNGPYSTEGCRTQVRYTMSVIGAPAVPTLSGAATICPGASTTVTASVSGGTWTTNNPAVATVTSGGSVTGVSSGGFAVSYSVSNACGSTSAGRPMTVTSSTPLGPIGGVPYACEGTSSLTLTNALPGGTWSSTNTSIAMISSTGLVTSLVPGVDTIIYTYTNGCGITSSVFKQFTVRANPNAGTLGGISTLVRGTSGFVTASAPGGVWSSSASSIATVGTTGIVTGNSVGSATISYAVTNLCGTAVATRAITITSSKAENSNGLYGDGAVSVSIYPNPTNGTVTLNLAGATGSTGVIVSDLTGKVLMTKTNDNTKFDLDLSSLAAGTYVITLVNDGNTYTEKVIIQ